MVKFVIISLMKFSLNLTLSSPAEVAQYYLVLSYAFDDSF